MYLIASVLWALVLGAAAALAVFGVSAGFAWLYLFGDEPWPAAAEGILLVLGLAAGLITAIAVVWLGFRYAGRRAGSPAANSRTERRKALALLLAPLLLMLLIGGELWLQARDYEAGMNIAATREKAFADLVGSNHKLVGVDIMAGTDGVIRATVRMTGERDGLYRLSWRVVPSSAKEPLFEAERSIQVRRGDDDAMLTIAMDDLKSEYQAAVLKGRGGALVDEFFELEVLLDPALTQQETANLPPGEQRRLGSGESPLQSKSSARFPVKFTIAP